MQSISVDIDSFMRITVNRRENGTIYACVDYLKENKQAYLEDSEIAEIVKLMKLVQKVYSAGTSGYIAIEMPE